jgi:transcriptional regulator with XRE-family HTH domain
MKYYEELAELFKKARQHKKLTQAELASKAGLNPQYVSNWERGVCPPPMHRIGFLMSVLSVNPENVVSAMLADSKKEIEEKVLVDSKSEKSVADLLGRINVL